MAFKWIWNYAKRYKCRIAAGSLLVIVCSAMSMAAPYLSGIIVDNVIGKGKTNMLIPLLSIMIGVTITRSILRYTFQITFESMSQNVIYDIREDMYKHLQKLDFDFYDKTKTGDIMTRMTGDVDAVRHLLAWVDYMVVENALIFVFGIVVMFTINYKFTLALVAFTPFIAYFTRKLAVDVKPTFFKVRHQFSRLNSVVQENISGNRVVKAFAKEDYEIEKFEKENEAYKEENVKSAAVWGKYLPIIDSLSISINIVLIIVDQLVIVNSFLEKSFFLKMSTAKRHCSSNEQYRNW